MRSFEWTIVLAGIFSIVFGILYLGLSISALFAHSCSLEMTDSPFVYSMYLTFFRVETCRNEVVWANLGSSVNQATQEQPDMPSETEAVWRTHIFAISYLVLHAALIFAATFGMFGMKGSCLPKLGNFIIYFVPWILVLVGIIALDILATVFYSIDSINISSTNGFLSLLEIRNKSAVFDIFDNLPFYARFLPTIVLLCLTAKGFVFLIMELVIVVLLSRAGWRASGNNEEINRDNSRTNDGYNEDEVTQKKATQMQMGYAHKQSQDTIEQPSPPQYQQQRDSPNRYDDTSLQAFSDNQLINRNSSFKSEAQNSNPNPQTAAIAMVAHRNSEKQNQQNHQNHPNNKPERDIESRMSNYVESNGNVIITHEPLKSEEPRSYPSVVAAPVNRPKVPPKPVYSSRGFSNSPTEDRPLDARQESRNSLMMKAPEELRSQLPWSYFKSRDDIPKKAFPDLSEGEDLPSVPVPDYTLHFPKSKRVGLDSDPDNGVWSGSEQRF